MDCLSTVTAYYIYFATIVNYLRLVANERAILSFATSRPLLEINFAIPVHKSMIYNLFN